MKFIFIFLFILLHSCIFLQKDLSKEEYFLFQQNERYGYKTISGKIAIKPEYMVAQNFRNGQAFVADRDKWMLINKKNRIILLPLPEDNFPDDYREGLARFIQNDKIGFFNEAGEIIIPAEFDFAQPFKRGKARVNMGCVKN